MSVTLNYNQFGCLHDSTPTECPYTGEETTIFDVFEETIKDDMLNFSAFCDRFSGQEGSEAILTLDLAEEMIDAACDDAPGAISLSDMMAKCQTEGQAYDYLYDYVDTWQEQSKKMLAKAEATAVELFTARMDELEVTDSEIRAALLRNLQNKGTASRSYLDALESGDLEHAEVLLERMEIAKWRHEETNYDSILSEFGKEYARMCISDNI